MRFFSTLTLVVLLAGLARLGAAEHLASMQPVQSPSQPPPAALDLVDHKVAVTIQAGFADVEVWHTFANPNPSDLEAVYRLPLPPKALLSELTIIRGEQSQHGEVVEKAKARSIYEQEKAAGNDAGLAEKDEYRWFEFRITPVPANDRITMRHRYYQPLVLDHSIGRFCYPRQEGGTEDPAANNFWQGTVATGTTSFTFDCTIRSAWPIADVRIPGFDQATISHPGEDIWQASVSEATASDQDIVVYYRLDQNLPGRLEIVPYKPDADKPGYAMVILTPGLDLKPTLTGTDFTFVLDVSGSMAAKLGTLASGIQKALGRLRPDDRFRVITFNNRPRTLINWTPATTASVQAACNAVATLQSGGGTNMRDGIAHGLNDMDADRPAAMILVTDGVTNAGIVRPQAFAKLSRQQDVRIFGFLMGNSANWPLIDLICSESGGFYAGVSNQDDIIGQLILAKEKMTRECLHDSTLKIRGVRTFDTTGQAFRKIYHGQQFVFFTRYDKGGQATITLDAKLTGQDKTYTTTIDLPNVSDEHPELARMWAMSRIEDLNRQAMLGAAQPTEAQQAERDLGIAYQIVTDETSMLVLDDAAFQRHGIDRHNQQRIAAEQQARAQRQQQPVRQHRADKQQPMFQQPANTIPRHRSGGGGAGAVEHWLALLVVALIAGLGLRRRRTA